MSILPTGGGSSPAPTAGGDPLALVEAPAFPGRSSPVTTEQLNAAINALSKRIDDQVQLLKAGLQGIPTALKTSIFNGTNGVGDPDVLGGLVLSPTPPAVGDKVALLLDLAAGNALDFTGTDFASTVTLSGALTVLHQFSATNLSGTAIIGLFYTPAT